MGDEYRTFSLFFILGTYVVCISFSLPFLFFNHVPWRPCPGAAAARFPVEGPARLDHQFGLERTSSDCVVMLTPVDASASRLFPSQLASAQRCSDVIRA
ncbi:hypothetical protein LB505_005547 [Fusarium chuoi]|nr:hypothetical protein LB505_005547 [Fusarium chuoi]